MTSAHVTGWTTSFGIARFMNSLGFYMTTSSGIARFMNSLGFYMTTSSGIARFMNSLGFYISILNLVVISIISFDRGILLYKFNQNNFIYFSFLFFFIRPMLSTIE